MEPLDSQTKELLERALAEDLGQGDVTTETLVSNDQQGKAILLAKSKGVIAGTEVAREAFLKVDPELKVDILIVDGTPVVRGDIIATIEGRAASILKAERVALNFLQHLSGIASETACYVEAVKGLRIRITDTRKTLPGLRTLQKYAVWIGGGKNHRMHLGAGFLIKDNHLVALRRQGLSMKEIIAKARQKAADKLTVEIEVKNLQEAAEAAEAGADIIMLDNMSLEDMHQAVKLIGGRALVEASGGITLERVRAIAETGVNLISVGALTHSVRALDISLELEII
ncbi:MAG: carboxylating nicotinate-nucleotide diphosphorylase [Chloroflexi bacterium]|nr:carboxylating nicotinate-nucleotide diphosphorylase [Chloroflexota bacterium]MBM3182399.1 carboxylating nicotinate-nucleotide diphosphorylase [Chloroflexota bacterium]MBM4452227.1 carboxylating nicotinate-nucleotide diphosphorylase [Chloroflexota bacterium]MBM4454544.1 carboxylating nicotinate-nucleotide diphosphorylase [Chloroflexota bacterium]